MRTFQRGRVCFDGEEVSAVQDDLDQLLTRLAGQEGPALTGLEARVWAGINARQRELSSTALWGWRSAAAALVLIAGIAIEAAATAQGAPELALFNTQNALAPSTLLGEQK